MPEWMAFALGIGGPLTGALVAIWNNRGSFENKRIDQLQEDLSAEREENKKLYERIGMLEGLLVTLRKDNAMLSDRILSWKKYHHKVVLGLADNSIPPLPELANELLEEL